MALPPNSKLAMLFEQTKKRGGLSWFVLRILLTTVRCADALVAIILMSAGFLFYLAPLKLLTCIGIVRFTVDRDHETQKILFLSVEGHAVAPCRVRCYEFAEALNKMGRRAEVFTFFDHIFRFKSFSTRYVWQTERTLASIIATHRLLPKGFNLVVHQRPSYDLFTGLALRWLTKAKLVVDIDDWIFHDPIFWLIPYTAALPTLGRSIHYCIVPSKHLEDHLKKFFPNVYRIPTFANIDRFVARPTIRTNQPSPIVFGWNGTIFHLFVIENIRILLAAFHKAHMQAQSGTMKLELLCGGILSTALTAEIEDQYPDLPIVVKPWQSPNDMPEYLQSIDIGLYALGISNFSSEKETKKINNFQMSKSPTKLFEYMATGLPVISTAYGEAKYFIEDGANGFVSDTIDVLAQRMLELAKDPALRTDMGTSARATCERHYSTAQAAHSIDAVIREMTEIQTTTITTKNTRYDSTTQV